ncbi:hypothetical protein C8A00DRAFT_29442 [Chaetomidium leptoderma]|uniref:Uncharacterized protein n=1 Tax=Chaetomidium leptoderma TaxID=669021 RepID=A0AAN7A140_9PEZI|nr:hypothetical protein C8A00DRAFT_29442 [Chaetomidium leptoderma]
MATFPPIDMAIAAPAFRFVGDDEPGRGPRRLLQVLAGHDENHNYPYCWGYTIFRTVYTPGSDEAFARAIERLGIYAKAYVNDDIASKRPPNKEPRDPRPNQDLCSRYYNEVVEDGETLANASLEEVGRRFDAWINEHLTPDALQRGSGTSNARFRFCLMLDQESVDNILASPEEPYLSLRTDRQRQDGWVKVVTDEQRPEGGRLWFRVGIRHFLWSLWFDSQDPDFFLEEQEGVDEGDGVLTFMDHGR